MKRRQRIPLRRTDVVNVVEDLKNRQSSCSIRRTTQVTGTATVVPPSNVEGDHLKLRPEQLVKRKRSKRRKRQRGLRKPIIQKTLLQNQPQLM